MAISARTLVYKTIERLLTILSPMQETRSALSVCHAVSALLSMKKYTDSLIANRLGLALLQRLAIVLVVCSLLLPKLTLAGVMLFGEGYRSVVICSGSQLIRVTISPNGDIVEDVTQAWVAPHCVLIQHNVNCFDRAWQRIAYPHFIESWVLHTIPELPLRRVVGSAVSGCDPPLV